MSDNSEYHTQHVTVDEMMKEDVGSHLIEFTEIANSGACEHVLVHV